MMQDERRRLRYIWARYRYLKAFQGFKAVLWQMRRDMQICVCGLVGHDWEDWGPDPAMPGMHIRNCQRCGFLEDFPSMR